MHFSHSFVCSLLSKCLLGVYYVLGILKWLRQPVSSKSPFSYGEDRHIYRKVGTRELGDPEFRTAVLSGAVTISGKAFKEGNLS